MTKTVPLVVTLGLLYLAVQLRGQVEFGCSKTECAKEKNICPDLDCENGRIVKNASYCGCCDLCVMPLKEGEKCADVAEVKIPRVECGPGLACNSVTKTCQPGHADCTRDKHILEVQTSGQEMTTGKPMPKCDQFGYYEPVQCKPGMMCYCVDRKGERIFGTTPYTQESKVDCHCSRDFHELVTSGLYRGDNVTFLRCDSSGNYQEPQCTDTDCYCTRNGEQTSIPTANKNWTLKNLPCHDSKVHPQSFMTQCLLERGRVLKVIRDAKEQGITMLGLEPPECDLDGTFAPRQCKGNMCYCVNKEGSRYPKGEARRYSTEAKEMDCRCLREKELFKTMLEDRKSDLFASYKCKSNGNYLPVQCSTNICYCVDRNGFQDGDKAVTQTNIKDLTKCYKEEYDEVLGIL